MSAINEYYILQALLKNDCLTAAQIGQILGCSRRTIMNHMEQVRELAQKEGLHLVSRKGHGYQLIDPPESKSRFLEREPHAAAFGHRERLYCILFLLLSQNQPVYMTELEHTFHVSRSSIYSSLDLAQKWLSSYDIELVRSRRAGITLSPGEKRRRLALSYWYREAENLAKNSLEHLGINKLQKELQFFENLLPLQKVYDFLEEIKGFMHLSNSNVETERLPRFLQIALIRQKQGFLCTMPEQHFEILTSLQIRGHIERIMKLASQLTGCEENLKEAIYLHKLILSAYSSDLQTAFSLIDSVQIDPCCIQDIMSHLDRLLKLSPQARQDLRSHLIYRLKWEFFFDIYDRNPSMTYYASMLSRFQIVQEVARVLGHATQKHYNIAFYDRYLYTLCLLIRRAIEASKRRLHVLFLHDCDTLELDIMHLVFQNNIQEMILTGEYPFPPADLSAAFLQQYDLILSVQPVPSSPIPVIVIPKILSTSHEINRLSDQINHYYQVINYREIVLDKSIDLSGLL